MIFLNDIAFLCLSGFLLNKMELKLKLKLGNDRVTEPKPKTRLTGRFWLTETVTDTEFSEI